MAMEIRGVLMSDGTMDFDGAAQPEAAASSNKISEVLLRIFQWEASAGNRYGWQDLPGSGMPLGDLLAPDAPELRRASRAWQRSTWTDVDANARASLNVSVPAAMNQALPASDQICVAFDAGIVVPDALAHIYSAGFASGVAACWMIGNFLDPGNIGLGDPDLLTPRRNDLVNYASYGATHIQFEARRDLLADMVPLETEGLFRGWSAEAEALTSATRSTNEAIKDAIFSRFNWETLGEVTSHTMAYLLGFIQANSLKPPAARNEDAVSIATLKSWESDPESQKMSKKIEGFMGDLFAALLLLEDTPVNKKAAANIHQFLVGYHRGLIVSSRELFFEAVQLGYGIGYRHGFRTGYNRGYRDGYRAGFKDGLGNFLDDIVAVTNNIREISGNVAKVVAIFAG